MICDQTYCENHFQSEGHPWFLECFRTWIFSHFRVLVYTWDSIRLVSKSAVNVYTIDTIAKKSRGKYSLNSSNFSLIHSLSLDNLYIVMCISEYFLNLPRVPILSIVLYLYLFLFLFKVQWIYCIADFSHERKCVGFVSPKFLKWFATFNAIFYKTCFSLVSWASHICFSFPWGFKSTAI